MQAATRRTINPGKEYDYLFPAAMNRDKTVVESASLEDTIAFIHKVVGKTLGQTEKIAQKLSGSTTYDTCRNIWHFVYDNVAYNKDADGLEQIRSPSRTWHDRRTGVDCDCYSTFISSILTNLHIPHSLRITKYRRNHFQHIYPIVPDNGKLVIIDCVTDQFNYEVPFSEKKDIIMDLQFLDGLEGINERGNDLVFEGHIGELGAAKKKKKKGFFRKVLNKINKINPATVLLRNGVLAAMKLNLFKVASRLKYAYLSPDEATKKGIIKDKFDKLVKVREKLESIFETAGGNPKNLKKAILRGKGNKNKEVAVSGLGFVDSDASVLFMNSNTPLSQLLGPEIYYDENVNGMEGFEGFGELGEPATGAAIATATAAVAAIAKIVKSIGNIFGSGQKGSEDFSETETAAADKEVASSPSSTSSDSAVSPSSVTTSSSSEDTSTSDSSASDTSTSSARVASDDSSESDSSEVALSPASSTSLAVTSTSDNTGGSADNQGFWQKNKKWLLPAVIGVGGIAAIAIGLKMLKKDTHSGVHGLEGTSSGKKPTPKKKQSKKKASVALM
jgi:hypothetical protein